jgi:hypothetical protein
VLNVSILRTDSTGGIGHEEHLWEFRVADKTLKFNAKTGAGTLQTGTQTDAVAHIDLIFTATSRKKAACSSGKLTRYSGTLHGDLSLVTGLRGGGTVGNTDLRFTMGTPQVAVDANCLPPSSNACLPSSAFAVKSPHGIEAVGNFETVSGKRDDMVFIARETNLKAPKESFRADLAVEYTAPASYDATTKVFSVTTSKSGLLVGSATLSRGQVQTDKETCHFAGKKYTISIRTGDGANYASPPGHSITARMSLSGTMTAPAFTRAAYYEVVTVKPSP